MNMLSMLNRKIGLFLLISLTTSCREPLQETVYSFISTDNFYKTAADAEASVVAAYQPFLSFNYYGGTLFNLILLADDQATIGRNPIHQSVDNFNLTADHSFTTSLWQQMYQCINRANTGIQRIPGIQMDATRQSTLVGECHLIRAYNYFNLVRLFGGIPLTTSEIQNPAQTNTPKATKEKIYEQIIADLKQAESVLPVSRSGNDVGRVTKGAAQTLLAEVYLTLERWQEAADKAQEVMQSGRYQLLPDFSRVFAMDNETNAEIIFSIQYDGSVIGSSIASFAHAGGTDNPNCANGVQVWSVEQKSDMWLNWDAKDSRRGFSVYDKFVSKAGKEISVYSTSRPFPAFGKYNAPGEISQANCPLNPIVHRYADVLLIYAEAISQAKGSATPEAYAAVNQVRRRAYKLPLGATSAVDLPAGLSKEAFRTAVIKERSLEFVAEGKRLFDLMRSGQFPTVLKAQGKTINEKATLFPIPVAELNANAALTSADQNPGY
jgi:starch-binding outer membrane protein, SusD/RagB family